MTAPQQRPERRAVRLDPDPLYVSPEPVTRLRFCRRCNELLVGPRARRTGVCDDCVGRGGSAVAWLGLTLVLVATGAVIALLLLATATPRAGSADLTRPALTGAPPHVSGSDGSGASAPSAGTTSRPTPLAVGGAPSPTTEVGPVVEVTRGWAAWYPGSRGWRSIAHVALPDSRYRTPAQGPSQWVTVTVFVGDSVRSGVFPAVDDCACGDRRGLPTVVDLSHGALRELGLWDIRYRDGIWRAEVQYGADGPEITLPPTDEEEPR